MLYSCHREVEIYGKNVDGVFLMELLFMLLMVVMFLLPVILVGLDIVFAVKKKEHILFEFFAFFMGGLYMLIGYYVWDLPEYTQPLNVWGFASAHEPINERYLVAVVIVAVWSFLSYLILKFGRKKLSPLIEVFLIAGIYIGIALSLVFVVQLLGGARPIPIDRSEIYGEGHTGQFTFPMDGSDYMVIFCLCLVPALFVIHSIHLLVRLVKEKAAKQEQLIYTNPFLRAANRFLYKGANLFLVAVVCILPVLGILVMLLLLFGQQPDGVILAFTKTSDWLLSGEISPPPVAYDTHYLCTVSLRGHKKLVKPTRFGIRRGEKIVVNRQLCVANAFEQLIEERAPRFHRAVRHFYDTYGYPISRHINSAWAADVVYLIMKPLEWIFVFVLYLFDEKPETRISSQYLPKEKIAKAAEGEK